MYFKQSSNNKQNIWQRFVENCKNKFELAREQIRFLKYEKDFGERDTDVYIVSFPRSGTTLLQVIAWHLTHTGGMDYKHLDDVSPWLRHLSVNQLPLPAIDSPRIIKTHDPYPLIPPDKKGRFIFVLRDAADVVVSNYHHWNNYNNHRLSLNEVFDKLLRNEETTGYFDFNRQWLENKKNLPILYLKYEDIVAGKRRAVQRIAAFLSVDLSNAKTEDLIAISSFENMKRNEYKFGEQPKEKSEGKVYNQFIRKGKFGEGRAELTNEQQALYSQKYGALLSSFEMQSGDF